VIAKEEMENIDIHRVV
jgi:hypothetical protein